ncbi:MAG: hypothetical protein PHI34_10205 [Acidobacteriota bacterium]|nr:hypothetical protein [Acidobacteriota bacterium]
MKKETRLWWAILLAVLGVRFALTVGLPVSVENRALYDDSLYIHQANDIVSGRWLGDYNDRTLLKGPMFPLFLAASHKLGVPFQTSRQLIYFAACLLLLVALGPAIRNRWARLGLFSAVLFDPLSLGVYSFTRVFREGFYSALTIAVVACVIGWMVRSGTSWRRSWAWAAAGGLFLGAFWITREEGPWIFPLIGAAVLYVVGHKKQCPRGWVRCRRLAASALLAGIGWAAVVGTVALTNKARYGFMGIIEYQRREFLSAYGALGTLRPERFLPRVVISKADRKKVYAVSPAFRELEPFLEGSSGEKWAITSAKAYPKMEGEICGGWFVHALREAVVAAGHARTATEAMAFYDRLGREIRDAGRRGQIDLSAAPYSMNPAWRREYAGPLFKAWWRGWMNLDVFSDGNPFIISSFGPEADLAMARRLLGTRLSGDGEVQRMVRIRISAVDRPITLQVGDLETRHAASFRWPDGEGRPGRSAGSEPTIPAGPPRGIWVSYNAIDQEALLLLWSHGSFVQAFPLNGSLKAIKTGPLRFRIDDVEYDRPFRHALEAIRYESVRALRKTYTFGLPGLVLAAAVFLCFPWPRRRRIVDPVLPVLFIGLILTACVRIALLAWIDAVSFPGISIGYLAPAHPLLVLAGGLVLGVRIRRRSA